MKKILILLLFSSCMSKNKLAQKCNDLFPCAPQKEVVTVVTKLDTIYTSQPLPPLPLAGIKCFQFNGKETIEIFRVPCTCYNQTVTKEKTVYYEDSAKIFLLSLEVSRLQKDSVKTAQSLYETKNRYDRKYYFYRNGFFSVSAMFIALAAFFIWRVTKE